MPRMPPGRILEASTHLQIFHEQPSFYTWLVRIAANESLMRLRKRRPNQFSLDKPVDRGTDLMPRELYDWRFRSRYAIRASL
jgi:RNA polymerase sigma-70 factor, ECF subfamily